MGENTLETKYYVVRSFRYASSKNWEYNLVGMYDNMAAAKQAFHDNMSKIIKATNDICMCIIFDSFGNKIDSDFNTTVEPEPENE